MFIAVLILVYEICGIILFIIPVLNLPGKMEDSQTTNLFWKVAVGFLCGDDKKLQESGMAESGTWYIIWMYVFAAPFVKIIPTKYRMNGALSTKAPTYLRIVLCLKLKSQKWFEKTHLEPFEPVVWEQLKCD